MMTADQLLAVASRTIRVTAYCSLVTLSALGPPHVRLMRPLASEGNLTIRLGPSLQSRKGQDMERVAPVILGFPHEVDPADVSWGGTAPIIDQPQTRQRGWREDGDTFLGGRPTGEDDTPSDVTHPESSS